MRHTFDHIDFYNGQQFYVFHNGFFLSRLNGCRSRHIIAFSFLRINMSLPQSDGSETVRYQYYTIYYRGAGADRFFVDLAHVIVIMKYRNAW
jgi:hypothetical protein